MEKESQYCERCGKLGRERAVDVVVDGYWSNVKVVLCGKCYENLRLADAPAWRWLREYADRLSK